MASWLSKVGLPVDGPIRLYGDNEGSQSLTENSNNHSLVKHIAMHHHIREKVARNQVKVVDIAGIKHTLTVYNKNTSPVFNQILQVQAEGVGIMDCRDQSCQT